MDEGTVGGSAVAARPVGTRPRLRRVAALAVVPLLPLLAACDAPDGGGASRSSLSGLVLPEPRPGGDFTLTATDGEPYRFAERTEGRLTVVFFGYTHCPDICPVTMANLGAALDRVPPAVQEQVEVVFVTTDPARDSLARIRSWLDRFDPSFVGLRGPLEEVNRIMDSYGLPGAVKEQPDLEEGYTVGHAGHVLVFSPEGPLRLMYPADTRQRTWVEDLSRLVTEGFPPTGASGAGSGAAGS